MLLEKGFIDSFAVINFKNLTRCHHMVNQTKDGGSCTEIPTRNLLHYKGNFTVCDLCVYENFVTGNNYCVDPTTKFDVKFQGKSTHFCFL